MAELAALLVGDLPGIWRDLGFLLDGDTCHVSGVRHVLSGAGGGVLDWGIRDVDAPEIDGLHVGMAPLPAEPTPPHPNGVVGLDHLVVATPDIDRTIAALEHVGVECRRTREAGRGMRQAFFKLGEVVLELVGPAASAGSGPPSLFGVAYTVADLDETAGILGPRLRPAKDAVQPGRRIATLDRGAGSRVAMAFMSA